MVVVVAVAATLVVVVVVAAGFAVAFGYCYLVKLCLEHSIRDLFFIEAPLLRGLVHHHMELLLERSIAAIRLLSLIDGHPEQHLTHIKYGLHHRIGQIGQTPKALVKRG